MIRTLSVIAGLAVSACAVNAAFLSLEIREDKTLPVVSGTGTTANPIPSASVRTFNLYAKFDGAGTATGVGRANTVLSCGQPTATNGFGINLALNPGANFYQGTAQQGCATNNVNGPDVGFGSDRALYDSWLSIGQKYTDSSADPAIADTTSADNDFAFANTDAINGPASSGLSGGFDTIRGGWYNGSPPNLQGAAQPHGAEFLTFLGQLSISGLAAGANVGHWVGGVQPDAGNPDSSATALTFDSSVFSGRLTVFRQGGVGEDAAVAIRINFIHVVPTPGSMALFGLAGLVVSRRRRA